MLLPRPPREDESQPEDPRAELVRRLLEYERMKRAAASIGELPVAGRDFSVVEVFIDQAMAERIPNVNVADLSEAWRSILARAKMTRHHKITREQLSVRAHMTRILRTLQSGAFVEFSALFEPERGIPVLVVSFLALLELARESLIDITQQTPFDPIYVKIKAERPALAIS
jgi:segregation and condensation protein A